MPALQLRPIEGAAGENAARAKTPEPPDAPFPANRRATPREPAHDLCEIVTHASALATACLAHNLSSTGALLETGASGIPDRFVLVNHTKKTRTVCHVVWRCGRMAGVRFTRPPRSFG
jgi:hypothetical protein